MEIPKEYNGMELVKAYKDFALYKNKYYRMCFNYHDLGFSTVQIKKRKIYSRMWE